MGQCYQFLAKIQADGGISEDELQPIREQTSIRQPGQLIVQRILFSLILEQHQFVLGALTVGDVVAVKIGDTIR